MAVQLIDIGRIANDGTGDDLREAFIKVNQNFEEIDLRQPEQTTASNRGAIGEGVYFGKSGFDLQFKKLISGTNITLASTDNAITINATDSIQSLLVASDAGSKILSKGDDQLNILGGANVSTSISGNTLTITNTGIVELIDDTTPQLGGDLDGLQRMITNVNVIQANTLQADNLEGLVYDIDIRDIDSLLNGFDFGGITVNLRNILEYIQHAVPIDVDFGTFTAPADAPVDLGTI